MSKRKNDLIEYLDVLLQVNRYGIGCDDKIKVVLDELHKEMGFGSGDIYNITINQHTSENSKDIVDNIMKNLKRVQEKDMLTWSKSSDSITSTYDGGIKVTDTITEEEKEETENPFDTIE